MRVLYLLEDSSKVDLGGGQRVSLDVLDALAGQIRVVVFDPAPGSRFGAACRARGVQVVPLVSRGRIVGGARPSLNLGPAELWHLPGDLLRSLVILGRHAARERPARLYATTKRGLLLAVLGRAALGLPFVFHAHSLETPRGVAFAVLRAAARQAERVICPSAAMRQNLGLPEAEVVPNAVEVAPAARPRLLPAGPVRVAVLATLVPWKGVHVFLAAAEHLAQPARVRLHVYGSGPAAAALARQAGPGVTFHGRVDDVPRRLAEEIDLVVVPSVEPESFGLAALEALAAGVPVITTALGGAAEVVPDGRAGVHVPPGDPAAIARAIDRYLTAPLLYAAHSAAALAQARTFSRERFATAMRALLLQPVRDPRGG